MKLTKVLSLLLIVSIMLVMTGCISQQDYDRLRVQNQTQSERLAELESRYNAARIEVESLKKQLSDLSRLKDVNVGAYAQEIEALETAIAEKNALISQLQAQLLKGGVALPAELNVMLEELAAASDLVEFDSERGMVKFKSDLTFAPGSDVLNEEAVKAIRQFSDILNSEMAKDFDAIIAGHTDDMVIAKAATKAKHPTNWHLSANRAISVLDEMLKDGVLPTRLSIRGFGEYRPTAPNAPNKRGNVLNRRVEVYIVAQGV
jgi:chemotaxis protein MotB